MKRLPFPPVPCLVVVLSLPLACDTSKKPPGAPPPAADPVPAAGEETLPDAPPAFTNLQVLPEGITRDELLATMKRITRSLGVRCNYCHRTDARDYASDEIKKKTVAREMLRMVERIDRDHFTWKDAPAATCYMCHHGEKKPQLEP